MTAQQAPKQCVAKAQQGLADILPTFFALLLLTNLICFPLDGLLPHVPKSLLSETEE